MICAVASNPEEGGCLVVEDPRRSSPSWRAAIGLASLGFVIIEFDLIGTPSAETMAHP